MQLQDVAAEALAQKAAGPTAAAAAAEFADGTAAAGPAGADASQLTELQQLQGLGGEGATEAEEGAEAAALVTGGAVQDGCAGMKRSRALYLLRCRCRPRRLG